MRATNRAFLLILAVALAVVVFCLGTSFTYSSETVEQAVGSELFWLLLGVVLAAPLWIPAILSARSRLVAVLVHGISVAALLIPLRYAGSVALHQAQFYPHPLFSPSIFAVAVILSGGCIVAIVILLWSTLPRAAN